MSSQRSSKPNQPVPARSSSASSSPSFSSHSAMVELKQKILNSLSKLADRDTHQIAVEDLEQIIHGLSNDGVAMFLNCLYDATADPKPAVKKEGLRLLTMLSAGHTDTAAAHLTKIIAHIVKRLKDSDSQVRDACRDAVGSLAGLYVKCGNGGDGVVSLFVKPLFEVMGENNKTVQNAAAMCLASMIERAPDPPLQTFQKLCPRVCKYLNNQNFLAKASLLHVVSSLSQVGAITTQNLESLMQSTRECLASPDWATRKAAAEALVVLSLNSRNITPEEAASTLNALEACRFDKIKPARESITEALLLWKKITGKGNGSSEGEASESVAADKKDVQSESSPSNSSRRGKVNSISDKAAGILKKKAPALTDKELNPEFFQKLEARGSGELPVEVIVPRRCVNPSNSQNEEESDSYGAHPNGKTCLSFQNDDFKLKHGSMEKEIISETSGSNLQGSSNVDAHCSRNPSQSVGFMDNKGNWSVIQKQLLQLERQQDHLMNMLQDFMGGSHNSMLTLENRVHGLERVVEDMTRDLSISAGRRGSSATVGFEGSSNRSLSKYSGFSDHSGGKLGRVNDVRIHFGDRFAAFDSVSSVLMGRGPPWRPDASDSWEFQSYGKISQMGPRRAAVGNLPEFTTTKTGNENDQIGSRRGWENGAGPVRFGEGPSARSVWQASKDEATLEAIRIAGEDNGISGNVRVAVPEMAAEALAGQDSDPVWNSWSNAMDALHVGDVDSAFSEVLSTGDEVFLVKLMEKSGPVIDQLSNKVAGEVLHAVSQFLTEQNLFELCLCWVQQLADILNSNEHVVVGVPAEVKREILRRLHEVSSFSDLPEDWEGSPPDQLLLQLASAWEIDVQHFGK